MDDREPTYEDGLVTLIAEQLWGDSHERDHSTRRDAM